MSGDGDRSDRAGEDGSPDAAPPEDPPGRPRRRRGRAARLRRAWRRFAQWWDPEKLLGALFVAIAGSVLSAVIVAEVLPGSGGAASQAAGGSGAVAGSAGSCHFRYQDGRLYAGHSRTMTRIVGNSGGTNSDTYEVQCLLEHAGISPGGIDGVFGTRTVDAVEKVQGAHGIPVDGVVGPQTWKVLRALG